MYPGRYGAAEKCVADTGWCIGQVAHDAPTPVDIADDVDGVVREPPAMGPLPECGEAVARASPERDVVDDRVAQQGPSAVEIDQDRLEHPHASDRPVGERHELVAVDHQRDRIEPPRPGLQRDHAAVGPQR